MRKPLLILLLATLTASPTLAQEPPRSNLPATRPSTRAGGAGIEMPPATRPFRNPLSNLESSKRARSIVKALTPLSQRIKASVGVVEHEGKELALATVVRSDGYLLTKASELETGYTYKLRMASGLVYDATVTAIADMHDLALLRINAANLQPVEWISTKEAKVGEIVFTPGPQNEPLAFGVVSVGVRPSTGGAIGVGFPNEGADTADGVRIMSVSPGLPAQQAGIQPGDLIQKINDQDFTERAKLSEFLQSLSAGTEVSITVLREKEVLVFRLTLASRSRLDGGPSQRSITQNNLGSILSRRTTDFAAVLQHDTVLMSFQQGSPLIDLDGKALGINIARAGRVETYAVPSDVIQSILPDLIGGKYPKENPAVAVYQEKMKREAAEKAATAKREANRPLLEAHMKENRRRAMQGLPPLPTPDFTQPATQPSTRPITAPHPQLGIDPKTQANPNWNNGAHPVPPKP